MEYPSITAHGIMFHHFHDEKHYRGQGSISREDFEGILHFIGLNRIINPDEWIKRFHAKSLNPEDLCITLDDSLKCQFDIALPVLSTYGLKAFWFIYSDVFEGKLNKLEPYRVFRLKFSSDIDDFYQVFFGKVFHSEFAEKAKQVTTKNNIRQYKKSFPFYSVNDIRFRLIRGVLHSRQYEYIMDGLVKDHGFQIEELSRNLWMSNEDLKYLRDTGHSIGLHSYSHPMVLATLSYEEQLAEYKKNYQHIKKVSGEPPLTAAHPVNSYNEDTFEILEELGIVCGFTSNMSPGQISGRVNGHKYELSREDHSNIIKIMAQKAKIKNENQQS